MLVGVAFDAPTAVDDPMVEAAEAHEIVEVGSPLLPPPAEVMCFAPLTALAVYAAGRRWFSPEAGLAGMR